MTDDIFNRLERIYAALGQVVQKDPAQFGIVVTPQPFGSRITFGGDMSSPQRENVAQQAILLVGHLPDHLRRWARERHVPIGPIETLLASSVPVQVIVDLANREKHGGDARDGGLSKRRPRLVGLTPALRFTGGGEAPSVSFSLGPDGISPPIVHGNAEVVLSGQVVGADGQTIGELPDLLAEAVTSLEVVFSAISLPPHSSA